MRPALCGLTLLLLGACDQGSASGTQTGDSAGSDRDSGSQHGSDSNPVSASDGGTTPGSSTPDASQGTSAPDGGVAATDAGSPITSDGGTPNAFLPPVKGTCPTIANGTQSFAGQDVQIWAGAAPSSTPGSLVIVWHGTGGSSFDTLFIFGQAQIDAVTSQGGIVAAISGTNKQGTDTGNGVWYTGDFDTADQIVACALQQKWIDARRIYTMGDSAGGLQAAWMAYARSGYLAALAPLSGGLVSYNGLTLAPVGSPQDPSNVPSALVIHGATGSDVRVIDFAVASAAYEADIAKKGGFSIDCNTQGGHVSGPPQICPAIWQFFQDHPFGIREKYASGLPSVYPNYCQIGPRAADGSAP